MPSGRATIGFEKVGQASDFPPGTIHRVVAGGESRVPNACMNPWLEARFNGGMTSNCMSCHQRSTWPQVSFLPVTRGGLSPDDPFFAGKTKLDFLWSIGDRANWGYEGLMKWIEGQSGSRAGTLTFGQSLTLPGGGRSPEGGLPGARRARVRG
jgi:hypothetical protein